MQTVYFGEKLQIKENFKLIFIIKKLNAIEQDNGINTYSMRTLIQKLVLLRQFSVSQTFSGSE